jgi:hypothetical protein
VREVRIGVIESITSVRVHLTDEKRAHELTIASSEERGVALEKRGSGHVVQITTSLIDHALAGAPSVVASLAWS